MVLTLEISGPEAAKLGANKRKVFRNAGGTIGRAPENEWVLPDPNKFVSSRHAVVRYSHADGVFFLDDTSRNGIAINGSPLKSGQPYPLQDGDVIGIAPFEILVSISVEAEESPFQDDDFLAGPAARRPSQQPIPSDPFGEDAGDPFLDLLRPGPPEAKKPSGPEPGQFGSGSVLDGYFKPPAVTPSAQPPAPVNLIPEDWAPSLLNVPVKPAPTTPPAAPPAPAPVRRPSPGGRTPDSHVTPPSRAADVVSLADVLKGAGFPSAPVTPELAQHFGEILRVVVTGVMELLQARQRIKDEFRVPATRFTKTDNNPLKFSADVEDALHNILVKRGAAYLGPVEAFEDAFEDLRAHQMAVLEGMRVAFESMLQQFSPDRLQEEFDRVLKSSMVPAKMRYWELYRDKVRDMVSDADESFRELFGNEFAKAYEQQLARLKAEARAGKV